MMTPGAATPEGELADLAVCIRAAAADGVDALCERLGQQLHLLGAVAGVIRRIEGDIETLRSVLLADALAVEAAKRVAEFDAKIVDLRAKLADARAGVPPVAAASPVVSSPIGPVPYRAEPTGWR